jgi:hypothetical protein
VEFSGNGWDACLGQAWNVDDGRWARWALRDYNRVIDYETIERGLLLLPSGSTWA